LRVARLILERSRMKGAGNSRPYLASPTPSTAEGEFHETTGQKT
jgi:hypothetical protein